MTTQGMDTAAGVAASGSMEDGSQQLLALATRLDHAISSFDWDGPDAVRTRDVWADAERPALTRSAEALASMALLIRREAAAQDAASGEATGSPSATTGIATAPPSVWDNVRSFVGERISAFFTGQVRAAVHLGNAAGKLIEAALGIEDHSVAEIAASALAGVGAGIGSTIGLVTGKDHQVMAERPGEIGIPRPVPTDPAGAQVYQPALTPPRDLPSLMQSVTDSYQVGSNPESSGDIRITRIDNGTPHGAYVVAIPGTETWNPSAGEKPRDLTANLNLVAGNPTAAAEAVRKAMEAAGIPPGAQVMLVGHSQGGIVAAQLASDPAFVQRYGVSHVLTYGAPIDHLQLADGVRGLQVQHQHDVVPRVDLGGVGVGGTNPNTPVPRVVLDSPGPWYGAGQNHSHTEYINSVREELGSASDAGQRLRDYEASLTPFLVRDGGTATAVDVPIRRGE